MYHPSYTPLIEIIYTEASTLFNQKDNQELIAQDVALALVDLGLIPIITPFTHFGPFFPKCGVLINLCYSPTQTRAHFYDSLLSYKTNYEISGANPLALKLANDPYLTWIKSSPVLLCNRELCFQTNYKKNRAFTKSLPYQVLYLSFVQGKPCTCYTNNSWDKLSTIPLRKIVQVQKVLKELSIKSKCPLEKLYGLIAIADAPSCIKVLGIELNPKLLPSEGWIHTLDPLGLSYRQILSRALFKPLNLPID